MTLADECPDAPRGEPVADLRRMANVRDLGGLRVDGGGVVRRGVLYRSDQPLPGDLSPDLDPWPPAAIIDLRSPHELRGTHPLAPTAPRLLTLTVLDDADPARLAVDPDRADMARLYARMLQAAGTQFAAVAAAVADSPGPALVHCAAGKDRTGIAVAIVLTAVGVVPDDVVADYQATTANAPALMDRLVIAEPEEHRRQRRHRLLAMAGALMATPRLAIDVVLDELTRHPDGAAGWLIDRGLTVAQLELLQERLVDHHDAGGLERDGRDVVADGVHH